MYEVQLNAYALIGESLDLKPVSDLALIYMEPITDSISAAQDENQWEYGFSMGFSAMGVYTLLRLCLYVVVPIFYLLFVNRCPLPAFQCF